MFLSSFTCDFSAISSHSSHKDHNTITCRLYKSSRLPRTVVEMRLFLLASFFLPATLGLKYFIYIPLLGHSHVTFLRELADTLTDAGHDVTVLAPIMEPLLLDKTTFKTKRVILVDIDPRVNIMINDSRDILFKKLWTVETSPLGMMEMKNNMTLMFGYACEKVINEDRILADLKKEHFDAGISEPFNFCGFGIMEHLGIQTTIGAFSGVYLDLVSHYIGEPTAASYVPGFSGTTDNMGMFKRLGNLFGSKIGFWMFDSIAEAEGEYIKKKWVDYSGHGKLLGDISFFFINSNPYIDFPRPLIHKTVQIGGITVDISNPGKLDEKWDRILSERKKTVFISFGSVAKSKDMPENYKQSILKVAESMPDVTFIWKYEEESKMADYLKNVYLSPWLPQKALLADDRLSVFITHGGLGSSTELAYLGKPAIFIPLFAEQPRNAAMLGRHGTAISLDKEDLGDWKKIQETILSVLNDDNYRLNAQKLSKMLNNQPISARNLALSHLEFAAKFGPLRQLDPFGKHLSTIQYYFIDGIFTVAFLLSLLISASIYACKRCCCKKTMMKQKSD